MRIFVAYGYNERDDWIKKYVFPIIQAFNDEVVTGGELYGDQITDGVKQMICQSDAVIGFTTRRGNSNAEGKCRTHRWVTDEITFALANN